MARDADRNVATIRVRWIEHLEAQRRRPTPYKGKEDHARTFGHYGLGLGARFALLVARSGVSRQKLGNMLHPTLSDKVALALIDAACGQKETVRIREETVDGLLDWYQQNVNSGVRLGAFRCDVYDGADAVDRFDAWLRGDTNHRPKTELTLLGHSIDTEFHYDPDRKDDQRKTVVQAVDEFLSLTDAKTGEPRVSPKIIQVVHGDGMVEGLRAFARYIIGRLPTSDPRRVCFLPVSRYPPSASDWSEANISYATLVGNLDAFCAGRPLPNNEPPRAPHEIRAAIERIRSHLATEPTVLVMDGWGGARGSLSRLNSLVLDDGLVELLSEIIHPKIGADANAHDPEIFYQNRILVLSEGEFAELAEFQYGDEELPEPHPDFMPLIIQAQGRRHEDILIPVCDRPKVSNDGAMTILEDLIDLDLSREAYDAGLVRQLAADVETGALTRAWTRRLGAQDRLSLIILRFVALARDGVRVATLLKLLEQWEATTAGDDTVPAAWRIDRRPSSVVELEAILEDLRRRRLVIVGRDEKIHGLDDLPGSRDDTGYVDMAADAHGPRYIDFPSAMMRREILSDLFTDPDRLPASEGEDEETDEAYEHRVNARRRMIARANRLVAEACIAQHTIVARHASWTDAYDARHYRRLIQGIFHGFASLALGPDHDDPALRRIQHSLPSKARYAYDRLYSVYYRGLIEAPPNWDLSRVLGREDLKVDILLAAMNADDSDPAPWQRLFGVSRNLDARRTKFLDPSDETRRRVLIDQLAALARAAYHRADYPRAEEALEECWSLLPPTGGRDASAPERAALAKVEADVFIAQGRTGSGGGSYAEAVKLVRRRLNELKFPMEELTTIGKSLQAPAMGEEEAEWTPEARINERAKAVARRAGCDADLMAAWADLLCRHAEAQYLGTRTDANEDATAEPLRDAFAVLFFAERIRRLAFEAAPLKRSYYVNGHSTRVYIRVVHQLIQAHDQLKARPRPQGFPSRAWLVGQATRHTDMVTRYLSRLPIERTSLYVLQSANCRRLPVGEDQDLDAAEYHLAEADPLLALTVHRPRVRLRYTLERCKVWLARLAQADGDPAYANLAKAARCEVSRLECLAAKAQGPWPKDAIAQRRKADALCLPILAAARAR